MWGQAMQGTAGSIYSGRLNMEAKKELREGRATRNLLNQMRPEISAEVDQLQSTREEFVDPLVSMYKSSYDTAQGLYRQQVGEIDKMVRESEIMSRQGIDPATRQMMGEDIARSQAQYTQQASDLGAGLAGLGAAQSSASESIRRMNAMDAQMRQQNKRAYIQDIGTGVGMKQNAQQLLMQERGGLANAYETGIQFDQSLAEALAIQEEWNTVAPWLRQYEAAEQKIYRSHALTEQATNTMMATHGGSGGYAGGYYGNKKNGDGNSGRGNRRMIEKADYSNTSVNYTPRQSDGQRGWQGYSNQSTGAGWGRGDQGATNWGR